MKLFLVEFAATVAKAKIHDSLIVAAETASQARSEFLRMVSDSLALKIAHKGRWLLLAQGVGTIEITSVKETK